MFFDMVVSKRRGAVSGGDDQQNKGLDISTITAVVLEACDSR
jgi:hypothetical protein